MIAKARAEELMLAGKSDGQVVEILAEELPDAAPAELATDIKAARLVVEARQALARAEAEKAEKAAIESRVQYAVDEALKRIEAPAVGGKWTAPKTLKRFVHDDGENKGKWIDIEVPSEMYGKFHLLLVALGDRDVASAKHIDNEIRAYNKQCKAAEPVSSYSDALGGYAVPTQTSDEIYQLAYLKSVMMQNFTRDDIVIANGKIYPLMYGFDASWIADENTQITESQPTFTNPTINMARFGMWTNVSNTILKQRGQDLVNALTNGYASALAKFVDLRVAVGTTTGSLDKFLGLFFDANNTYQTAIARTVLTDETLCDMISALSAEADGDLTFVSNLKVAMQIGRLESTGGQRIYPQVAANGFTSLSPYGIPWLVNKKIPSTLDVLGGSSPARTGGTDDAIVLVDRSKFILGVGKDFEIATSEHARFTYDQTQLRGLGQLGCKVLSGASTAGCVSVCQELTN